MNNKLIGIDLGTTGCRSILFDEKLNILGEKYFEYPLITLSDRMIEQDADLWWELVKDSISDVIAMSNVSFGSVKGISISSQGIAFVPIDSQGKTLRNAISWLDSRAQSEVDFIKEHFEEHYIFQSTGKRIGAVYTLPKILWLKNNEPDIYEKTYKFLMPHDYIIYKLCGGMVTDHTMASGTMLYDINEQKWSDEILDAFEIEKGKLPELMWSSSSAGTIKKDVAKELGLNDKVIISVGGQDQKCAALGAGIDDKTATVSLGTSTAITKKWDFAYLEKEDRISSFSYLFKNEWVSEGVIGTAGASLKWLKNTVFLDSDYDDLNKIVFDNEYKDINLFFYPHLTGANSPFWYKNGCGCYYGITLNTNRADLIEALYEGIAFQINSNIIVMEQSGSIEVLNVFGGGSKSDIWCQTIADITNKTVKIMDSPEQACRGAAILAGLGCGIYTDIEQVSAVNMEGKKYIPDEKSNEFYKKKYESYLDIERRLWDRG